LAVPRPTFGLRVGRASQKTMTTAADLVGRGYLPRELPPPFNARALAVLVQGALTVNRRQRPTLCSLHNLGRAGGLRRQLRIPNPKGFIPLAIEVEALWPTLRAHMYSADLSKSRPIATTNPNERALIPRLRLNQIPFLRARIWPGKRYILATDIGQFYGSIYTHSVPWALHTKATAKANLGNTQGDALDKALRNAQQGQTVGIPIGPDTSLLVAELILTAVDVELNRLVGPVTGFRYIDDYELAFRTLGEAEQALATLEGILSTFELQLNPRKTSIEDMPRVLQENWVSDLHRFPVGATPKRAISDTVALFSRAFELARDSPTSGVLKYVLHRCRSVGIGSYGWRTFQGLVTSAVMAEPSAMPVAIDLLDEHALGLRLPLRHDGIHDLLTTLIERNSKLGNGSEVGWALWAAIHWQVPLGADTAASVSVMEDDFVALLALDAAGRGLFAGPLDTRRWEASVNAPGALDSEHWLLAYETAVHGWLARGIPPLARDPFFSTLAASGVQFYEPLPARAPFTGAAAPIPGGVLRNASI
jgi:hypothetical protein